MTALTPKLTEYITHEPTPKQQAFLLLECKDAFYGGAAGGGKSDALLMAALQYVDVPRYSALLVRDSFANLVMPGALMDRADDWLAGTKAKWDGASKTWFFPTTGRLKSGKRIEMLPASVTFGYLEKEKDHLKYKSAEFQFIGLDEATDLRWKQIIYLFSRLRRLKGHQVPVRFRLASNPGGISHNEIKRKYVDPKTRKKGVAFIPAGLADNPYLEEEEYKDSLSNLDLITRQQLMNGDWNVHQEGSMFRRECWQLANDRWGKDEVSIRVRYWDLAATDEKSKVNKEPCYTAGTLMAKHKDNRRVMVENVIRVRRDPAILEKIIRQTADLDDENTITIVEQDPGQAGKWQMFHIRHDLLPDKPFRAVAPTGNKTVRAMPYAGKQGDGFVYLLKGYWNEDYIDELEAFPEGDFADQVDSSSGAYKALFNSIPGGLRARTVGGGKSIRSIGGLSRLRGKR